MNRFERVFKETKQENDLNKVTKPVQATTVFRPPEVLDYEKDPRPDLEADHVLWVALLTTARERGEELFGILHCLRCGGAHLERDKDFGMLIRPGEWEKTEYEAFRAKHLAPRKAEVVEALRLAAQRLPQLQKDTLRSRVAARVKAIEAKALALGWTREELWAEKEWDDPKYGHRRRSVYSALLSGAQTWGHCEIAEITADRVVFELPSGNRLADYKVPPEFARPLVAEVSA
jgi:hypothetical protein